MWRTSFTLQRHAGALVFAALSCGAPAAAAAELGDATVRSYIGQPLAADIELNALLPDEVATLQVRLASPDVYRGANIAMHPALQSLSLSIVRREQRQFIRITSRQRIDADHLTVFLELLGGGRSAVRAATVWLSPDPAPAPAPEAPASPALAAARAQLAATPLPLPEPMLEAPSPLPQAMAPLPLPEPIFDVPSHPLRPPRATVKPPPPPPLQPQRASLPAPVPTPKVKPVAACAPQANGEPRQCAALDRKNAAVMNKLVELEGKVKVLQHGLGVEQPTSPPLPHSLAPVPLKPKPLNALPGAKKPGTAAAPKPLMLFGGGAVLLLLLIGLAVHLFLRRKRTKTPSAPSRFWALLRKPFSRQKRGRAEEMPIAGPVVET